MADKKFTEELITGAVIYAFLAFVYWNTLSMVPASALFPRIVTVGIAILNTGMVFQSFRKHGKASLSLKELLMPAAYYLGIIVYAAAFALIGYFPATAVMLIAYMLVLKVRPIWLIAAITAGYLVFIYVLFVMWLNTNLI